MRISWLAFALVVIMVDGDGKLPQRRLAGGSLETLPRLPVRLISDRGACTYCSEPPVAFLTDGAGYFTYRPLGLGVGESTLKVRASAATEALRDGVKGETKYDVERVKAQKTY